MSSECSSVSVEQGQITRGSLATNGNFTILGLPDLGVVHLFETPNGMAPPRHVKAIRAFESSGFETGPGFGISVAMSDTLLAVGAQTVTTGSGSEVALEHPSNIFTDGAVFTFSLSGDKLQLVARTSPEIAVGHSVAIKGATTYFGTYDKPATQDPPLALRFAAPGEIAALNEGNARVERIKAPKGVVGFGSVLDINNGLVTLAHRESGSTEVYSASPQGRVKRTFLPKSIEGQPLADLATSESWTAVSTSGGWSAESRRTILMGKDGQAFILPHGGALSLSNTRLAIVETAAPEGASENTLYIYSLSKEGEPQLSERVTGAIVATVSDKMVIFLQITDGKARLCRL